MSMLVPGTQNQKQLLGLLIPHTRHCERFELTDSAVAKNFGNKISRNQ